MITKDKIVLYTLAVKYANFISDVTSDWSFTTYRLMMMMMRMKMMMIMITIIVIVIMKY